MADTIFNKIIRYINTKSENRDLSIFDSRTWGSGGKIQPNDYAALVREFKNNVRSCVELRGTAVAAVPLKLYGTTGKGETPIRYWQTREVERKEKAYLQTQPLLYRKMVKAIETAEIVDHPFLDVMSTVNGFFNAFDLLSLTSFWLDLTGNAYWYIVKDGLGKPIEIWPIFHIESMRVKPDAKNFISGYIYKRGTKEISFDVDEIVHFKSVSPGSEYYGVGALMGCLDSVRMRQFMDEYEQAMFENMGRPDMALFVKNLTKERMAAIKEGLKQYTGPRNTGKMGVFEADEYEFKELGQFNPREMAFSSGRQYSLEEVARAFHVPMPILMGNDSNLASSKTSEYYMAKYATMPQCIKIQEKINEQFASLFDSRLFCAFENPVLEDGEFRLKEIETKVTTGYSTVNEERQIDGNEEVEGGDLRRWPTSFVPVEQAGQQRMPTQVEMESVTESIIDGAMMKLKERDSKVK